MLGLINPILPYLAITISVWITYIYTLKCGFVSDDLAGITEYDGKLQGYEYGMLSRWIRYHLCGGNFPSKKKFKQQDGTDFVIPQGKIPIWHHFLSVSIFNIGCLLLYLFLAKQFDPKLALLTVILFIVHPICTQSVAWISGLGYPLSLVWAGAILNLIPWVYDSPSMPILILGTLGFCLLQFLAIHAQFATMMLWVILLFLGYWHFAILGALISVVMGFDIIKQTIGIRRDEFIKQNMAKSIYVKPRKIVVALKTFLYYLAHTLVPSKMGLYHTWGFHYDNDVERKDWYFGLGFLAFFGLVVIYFLYPVKEVQLSILWFSSFVFIFLNWITIQQFVTERYVFLPTIGICLLISYFTQNHLIVYALIAGIYLCRTWMMLPTYDNELRFYQSNVWNFIDSEVAYGNLGVTYLRLGQVGSALDSWHQATRINPDYDVPYYNIFSNFRSTADMALKNGDYQGAINTYHQALPYLQKTLNCKICHFHEMWKKEHLDIIEKIQNPVKMLTAERERLVILQSDLTARIVAMKVEEDVRPVQSSIDDAKRQFDRLEAFMKSNGITPT